MTISRLAKWIGAIVIAGYIGTLITTHYSHGILKVGGPIYNKIVTDKDLVADILPPPAYLIEAYLEATLAYQSGLNSGQAPQAQADIAEHAARLKTLQNDYETRHAFWRGQDIQDNLKAQFLTSSYQSGSQFWQTVNNGLLPALTKGDAAAARQ